MLVPMLALMALAARPLHAAESVGVELLGYVGPGAGLTAIGALLAVLAMFMLALLGPILYPIRAWRRRAHQRKQDQAIAAESSSPEDPT